MRLLNAEPDGYDPQARHILDSIGQVTAEKTLTRAELLAALPQFDILLVRLKFVIDAEVLAHAPRLKVVVSPTTGVDHLDLDAMAQRGIQALTLRGETDFLNSITATAEHTWALLLALRRKLVEAATMGKAGLWNRDAMRGHELSESALGVVGYGRLGRMVARYGLAFGMTVRVYDPHIQTADFEQCSTLEALCAQSDVISLHLPLNGETMHLIDRPMLSHFKKGGVLINTSRGAIVDSQALLEALDNGTLAGAALDVVDNELDPARLPDHPLLVYARQQPNLLITPHIGGATFESMAKTERFMAQKLKDYCHTQGWL